MDVRGPGAHRPSGTPAARRLLHLVRPGTAPPLAAITANDLVIHLDEQTAGAPPGALLWSLAPPTGQAVDHEPTLRTAELVHLLFASDLVVVW